MVFSTRCGFAAKIPINVNVAVLLMRGVLKNFHEHNRKAIVCLNQTTDGNVNFKGICGEATKWN